MKEHPLLVYHIYVVVLYGLKLVARSCATQSVQARALPLAVLLISSNGQPLRRPAASIAPDLYLGYIIINK
jgi:hypothetical protein